MFRILEVHLMVRIGQWDLSKPRMKEIPFLLSPRNQQ